MTASTVTASATLVVFISVSFDQSSVSYTDREQRVPSPCRCLGDDTSIQPGDVQGEIAVQFRVASPSRARGLEASDGGFSPARGCTWHDVDLLLQGCCVCSG